MTFTVQHLRAPLIPDRVRSIKGQGFGFIPHRFLRDGFLSSLGRDELAIYLFLVLAANRHGVSYYGYDAICEILHMPAECYLEARNRLIEEDLIAFDGTRFQVLSLPEKPRQPTQRRPMETVQDFEERDPATIRALLRESFHSTSRR
jgi:hypothetical protein